VCNGETRLIGAEVTAFVSRREVVDGVTYVVFMECIVEKVELVGLFTGPKTEELNY